MQEFFSRHPPSASPAPRSCRPRHSLPSSAVRGSHCRRRSGRRRPAPRPGLPVGAALARHRANVLLPPARADPGRVGQLIAAAGSTLFQLAQQLFGDGAEALLLQRAEDDELIQTAHQLRPEPLFRLGNGGFRLLFKGASLPAPNAQRCALPGEESCAEVGVSRTMVLRKSALRPMESVSWPSSSICRSTF